MDYCLKFDSEAQANEVLFTTETVPAGDGADTVKKPKYDAVEIIGVITKPSGQTTVIEGVEVPVMQTLEGFHANVRHNAEAPELELFAVAPKNPVRVWA